MTLISQILVSLSLYNIRAQTTCDHSQTVNSEAIDLVTYGEKLCALLEWCIYTYVILGYSSGNPTKTQGASVRCTILILTVHLNYKISQNLAQEVDPIANVNNHPQSLIMGDELHQVSATTGFTADADVGFVGTLNPSRIDNLLYSSSSSNFNQDDIKTFLRKPVILGQGNLSTTDTVATLLYSADLPYSVINASASTIYQDKLRGFLGIRCDIHLRWQINGERFQRGRYMILAIPTGGSPSSQTSTAASINAHSNTLVQRTQCMRMEMDINCDTEANMDLPFISCMNYIPLSGLPGSVGTGTLPNYGETYQIRMYPYSPLNTPSGSTTASWTLWAHLENVELIGPATPQSRSMKGKGKSASEIEQEGSNVGPITKTLVKISNASSMLSSVPLIRDYALGVSWFSDLMAGAAHIFGWSKPINLAPVHRVTREVLPWFSNLDAADQSQPIALFAQNAVGVVPGFSGTDTDEMDFSFLKTIPGWNGTINWPTLTAAGGILFTIRNGPLDTLVTRTATSGVTINDYLPYQLISNYFYQWRGTMVYTIKFVKTEFHSGRLAFVFFPIETFNGGPSPLTLPTSAYCHREIIDLRYDNEVTFTIPYISSSPWRPTRGIGTYTGVFNCYVVDPLVAPSNVSNSIDLLVELSAGPDFEVSIPYSSALTPYMLATPQAGSMSNPKPQPNACALFEGTLGVAHPIDTKGINALATVGEHVSSFRTMLKMTNIHSATNSPAFVINTFWNIIPYAWPVISANGVTDTQPTVVSDLYGVLSSMFCFSRGGIRFKFIEQTPITSNLTQAIVSYTNEALQGSANINDYIQTAATDGLGSATYANRNCGVQVFHNVAMNLASEVQVPQYHKYHSRVNSEHMVNSALPYNNGNTSLTTKVLLSHHYPEYTSTMIVGRAASDDTNFGTFISVPPMVRADGSSPQ